MSSERIDALSRSLADSTSRRSLLKLFGVGVAGTAVTAVGLNEALAKKNNNGSGNTTFENQLTNLPVRGKGQKGTFNGKVDIVEFRQGGTTGIEAVGQLTGKVTGDAKKTGKGSKKTKNVNQQVVFPVTVTSGGTADVQSQVICEILNLVLGPIDLNLLGLRLQTNTIRIRLTANSQGGLLGSLLCGLLGPIDLGNLGALVGLLNQILAILRGL